MQDALETEFLVAPEQLEHHVRSSWQDCGSNDERPLSRTTTMNLVAVAPEADDALLRGALRSLFRSSPCLAFLVFLEENGRPLRSSFGMQVTQERKARRVLLECITLHAGRREQRRIASIIRPLLLDDLPTQFFWAAGVPDDASLLVALGSLADQIVVDSSLFTDPDADAQRLDALGLPVVDLAWLHLRAWRRALAEAFEHFTWTTGAPVEVTIRHGDTAGTRAASTALARWLGHRLCARTTIEPMARSNSPANEPCSLVLHTADSEIRIEHAWPAPQIRVSIDLPHACVIPYQIVSPARSRGELLALAARELGVGSARAN